MVPLSAGYILPYPLGHCTADAGSIKRNSKETPKIPPNAYIFEIRLMMYLYPQCMPFMHVEENLLIPPQGPAGEIPKYPNI